MTDLLVDLNVFEKFSFSKLFDIGHFSTVLVVSAVVVLHDVVIVGIVVGGGVVVVVVAAVKVVLNSFSLLILSNSRLGGTSMFTLHTNKIINSGST